MPNWCVNKVYVNGPKKDVMAFKEFVGNAKEGIFDAILPYPEKFLEQDNEHEKARAYFETGRITQDEYLAVKDGFNSGGYEWCLANWGVKWDVMPDDIHIVTNKDNRVTYVFDTPWGPPKPAMDAISAKFPTLSITVRFFEGGMGFKGCFKYEEGKCILEEHNEYRGHLGG